MQEHDAELASSGQDRCEQRKHDGDSGRYSTILRDGTESGAPRAARHLADGILVLAQRPNVVGVELTPASTGYALSIEQHDGRRPGGSVACDVGRAVALRIAFLASIDPFHTMDKQYGLVRVQDTRGTSDLLVSVRPAPSGACSVHIRRLVTPSDASASNRYRAMVASAQDQVGSWRLVRVIGQGAMGTVYRAEHVTLGRVAALKVMHEHRLRRPRDVFRFVREARAASRIDHPCAVTVYDFGATPDDRPYLVMELVDAPTLRSLVNLGPVEPTRALRIAEQLTASLEVAHAMSVVHRDVKPENVFLLGDSNVKLTDFGCAKVVDAPDETRDQFMVGTPIYMAPEQVQCQDVDARADLYAVGCVLFELLTGRPPFEAHDAATVLARHLQAPIPTLPEPPFPMPGLQALVRRALAKAPRDRFRSAAEMRAKIQAVIDASNPSDRRLAC